MSRKFTSPGYFHNFIPINQNGKKVGFGLSFGQV